MAGGALIGRECNLYYNAGTFGSPTWTLIPRAIDVSYSISSERGSVSSRISIWKMEVKSLNGLELTFGYRYRYLVTDAIFDALRPMALSNTKVEFAVCDTTIATSGAEYLRATYQLEMQMGQPMGDGVAVDFTAFLTSEEDSGTLREPAWTTV
jgi:hypothetical protein